MFLVDNVGPAMCLQKLCLARWAWLAGKSGKLVQVNLLITAVFESPGRIRPTPAGVMANNVLDKQCRKGLGGWVASYSNP